MSNQNGRGLRSQASPASTGEHVSGKLRKPSSRVINNLRFEQLEGEMRKRDWYHLVAASQENGLYTLFFMLKPEYRESEDIVHDPQERTQE